MTTADDFVHMAQALRLAERGCYSTSPNPRVGCVIVRDGVVVGEGWHVKAGEPHAEVHALRMAGEAARGATAYVTLEPCSHHGRTPPCADALVVAGVRRVVVAMQDPNPLVAGRGLQRLRAAGIEVQAGVLEQQAQALNAGFVSRMTRQRPLVRIKVASSLDGRTALANGRSFWITGPAARRDVHDLRARSCAVLTGIGSVLQDDPQLTVREVETARQPLRIVLDSQLRLPETARILDGGPLLIVCAEDAAAEREHKLGSLGAEVLRCGRDGRVDLPQLLQELGKRQLNEVMVEAGATLNGAFMAAGLADEVVLYFAPVLMGHGARGQFALPDFADMAECRRLKITDVRAVGQDWRITAIPEQGEN